MMEIAPAFLQLSLSRSVSHRLLVRGSETVRFVNHALSIRHCTFWRWGFFCALLVVWMYLIFVRLHSERLSKIDRSVVFCDIIEL